MKNIFKTKNNISQQEETNKKTLKSKIVKSFLFVSLGYMGIFATMTHYIDSKSSDIVSQEQLDKLHKIDSYDKVNNYITGQIVYGVYTDEMYNEDLKLWVEFQIKTKKDFDELFENDPYVRENFKEYKNNYELFSKETSSYDSYFLNYFLLEKTKNMKIYGKDFSLQNGLKISNIANDFFYSKISDSQLTENEKSNIELVKKMRKRFNDPNTLSKIQSDLFTMSIIDSLVIQDKKRLLPSKLSDIYYDTLIGMYVYSMKEENDNENIIFDEKRIKLYINYDQIENYDLKIRVNNQINSIILNKKVNMITLDFSNKSDPAVKNTFKLLNVSFQYLKLKNDIYDIKQNNSQHFSNVNYSLYNLLEYPTSITKNYFSEKIGSYFDKNYTYNIEGVNVDNITKNKEKILLSGFNNNNQIYKEKVHTHTSLESKE